MISGGGRGCAHAEVRSALKTGFARLSAWKSDALLLSAGKPRSPGVARCCTGARLGIGGQTCMAYVVCLNAARNLTSPIQAISGNSATR